MPSEFTISLAGLPIGIRCLFSSSKEYCKKYLSTSSPLFSFSIEQTDIDFEREKAKNEDIIEGKPVRSFKDEYLETLAIYRKIAEKLPEYDTLLFHGSAIALDGTAYLFTAKSGTGKSTHTRLWREMFGERAVMVNDDKPLISFSDDGIRICGTPWNGKHHLGTNIIVPLKAVCFIERGTTNSIEKISPKDAFAMLIQQCHRPADSAALLKTLQLIERLSQGAKIYRLKCNMDPEAAAVAFNGMNEE